MATACLALGIISPCNCLSVPKGYQRLRDFEYCNVPTKQNQKELHMRILSRCRWFVQRYCVWVSVMCHLHQFFLTSLPLRSW